MNLRTQLKLGKHKGSIRGFMIHIYILEILGETAMVGSLFRVGNSRMYSTNATPWMDNKHAILDKVMKKMDEVQVCIITSETTTKKPVIAVSTLAFVKELRTHFEDVVEECINFFHYFKGHDPTILIDCT
ncbi:uncharacterized protein LOC113288043 [Papaver somniferum]|uniref:uncharacterized protein LOC113288043 n=1 Tax=Papaver somniferum TaxID=3469 RepID=UPI000E6FD0B7|nr:uncharacterized protein LOC113288043 [Papaver somniferum]XP_026392768.1 uncharacterized protein LOC113288043 [Papaver somniferum]